MNALYLAEITIVVTTFILLPVFKRACDQNWLLFKLRSYASVDVQFTVDPSTFQEAMKRIREAADEMEKRYRS